MRRMLSQVLRNHPATPKQIADETTRFLQASECARIYAFIKATGTFPPRKKRLETG